ncbi:MAG TPA: hypothetical protein VKV34_12660, partial [Thermoleophilia bacterium]|nr:hypothetical protein [Thermoleophilia bacterium]
AVGEFPNYAAHVPEAAVGIAVHSAWVAAITLAGTRQSPTFVARARIQLAGDGLPDQAYHAAAETGLTLEEAEALIERWANAARAQARAGLKEAQHLAAAAGDQLESCAIAAIPRDLPPLASILRSHPLLHAGEGQLALSSIAEAAGALGLRVVHADRAAGFNGVRDQLAALGRQAGPPWAADQKKAAAAAIDALPKG